MNRIDLFLVVFLVAALAAKLFFMNALTSRLDVAIDQNQRIERILNESVGRRPQQ